MDRHGTYAMLHFFPNNHPSPALAAYSNVLAIISSIAAGFWPNAVQNAIQLPLNIHPIREARRQVEKLKVAPVTGVHSGWLYPPCP